MKKRSKWIALGAGLGIVAGAAFGEVPTGLVLGAAAGLLMTFTQRDEDDRDK